MEHTTVREVQINYKNVIDTKIQVSDSDTVFQFFRSVLPNNSQEHFLALYLDSAYHVIGYSVVFTGLVNKCDTHPREIFQRAIMLGSVAMITAHNHPTGNIIPSSHDIAFTKRLKNAAEILGITYLDNLVIADSKYISKVGFD